MKKLLIFNLCVLIFAYIIYLCTYSFNHLICGFLLGIVFCVGCLPPINFKEQYKDQIVYLVIKFWNWFKQQSIEIYNLIKTLFNQTTTDKLNETKIDLQEKNINIKM